jgi:hypothetical protein
MAGFGTAEKIAADLATGSLASAELKSHLIKSATDLKANCVP